MRFEQVIPAYTALWRLVEHVHETIAKGLEATLFIEQFRCTSYRDRGENTVKVQHVASGMYTMYELDGGQWVRMEGY